MTENKPMTLQEYNDKYSKMKEEEMSFYTRSTNIKCEKCDFSSASKFAVRMHVSKKHK